MSDGSESNGRVVFAAYQVGDVGDDMGPALRQVLGAHRERYGQDPVGVTVNKTLVGKAREALVTVGLPALEVKGCGGCLSWEIWLPVASNGDREVTQ